MRDGVRKIGRMASGTARLTRADVEHVAKLARLELSDDELETFTEQLAGILDHANQVAALDIADVPATAHPLPLVNVLRADVVEQCLPRDEVLAAAPSAEDGRFRVPRILGEAP
jgi:aspartyl-tRNA(Asn)/glutamyl-tRNA(Gln) amidotransferase subunit C